MSKASNYLENQIADHLFRSATYAKPTELHIALFTTDPTDADTGTEVSGGSYARVQLDPDDANWKGTGGETSGASAGTGGVISNNAVIQFPTPGANWGTITHFGIYDENDNLLVHGPLTASKAVNLGQAGPSFAVDALTVSVG